jgi:hypothetical protein
VFPACSCSGRMTIGSCRPLVPMCRRCLKHGDQPCMQLAGSTDRPTPKTTGTGKGWRRCELLSVSAAVSPWSSALPSLLARRWEDAAVVAAAEEEFKQLLLSQNHTSVKEVVC